MKISVIIPIYNVEEYLKECLDSVLSQSFTDLEVILVDDGSTDRSKEICIDYSNKDKRVVFISQKNQGQSVARNKGLQIASGDFIAFVDSDDIIDSMMFEKMLKIAIEAKCDIVRVNCKRLINNEFLIKPLCRTGIISKDECMSLILQDKLGSQPCFGIYKKVCWDGVFFPDGRVYEDLAVLYKVYDNCTTNICILDEALYIYRIRKQSTSFTISPNKNYDRYLAFKDRWIFAQEMYPECEEICFLEVVYTGLGTYNYYLRYFNNSNLFDKNKLEDVRKFLHTYKKRILKLVPFKKRFLYKLFFFNEKIYKLMYVFFVKKINYVSF